MCGTEPAGSLLRVDADDAKGALQKIGQSPRTKRMIPSRPSHNILHTPHFHPHLLQIIVRSELSEKLKKQYDRVAARLSVIDARQSANFNPAAEHLQMKHSDMVCACVWPDLANIVPLKHPLRLSVANVVPAAEPAG